jgi:hypothetical protein
MRFTSVRLPERDRELIFLAALRVGLSQSELIRRALRTYAERVLLDDATRHSA